MNYQKYKIEDFVADLDFIRWVNDPTDEDNEFWEKFMEQHPEKRLLINEAKDIVKAISENQKQDMLNDPYFLDSKKYVKARLNKNSNLLNSWKWAAVFLILVSSSFLVWQWLKVEQETIFETTYGETKEIVLPDQSKVILNANSQLKVSDDWSENDTREVWLEGEGYFEITEISNNSFPRQFKIHSATGIEVSVLGTSFNINDRRGKTEVVLRTGKVEIQHIDSGKKVAMEPGESVTYDAETRQMNRKNVDPDKYAVWTENKLVFQDVPINKIADRIEDIFGLKLIFKNFRADGKSFTGSTPYNDLEILLVTIAKSYGLEYRKQKEKIIMEKK